MSARGAGPWAPAAKRLLFLQTPDSPPPDCPVWLFRKPGDYDGKLLATRGLRVAGGIAPADRRGRVDRSGRAG